METMAKLSELSTSDLFNFLKFINDHTKNIPYPMKDILKHKNSIIAELSKRLKGVCEQS